MEEPSSLYSITSSIPVWLKEACYEWENDNSAIENTMYKQRDKLYGKLGVEERYYLV
jgi:hypothetical protein